MNTINGKEYTEFDINKRCAELMGFEFRVQNGKVLPENPSEVITRLSDVYEPCNEIQDTWTIIEKCWDELMEWVEHSGDTLSGNSEWGDIHGIKWEFTMQKHNRTKLVAACICFIEVKEGE